jgi:hypothetical protein
MKSLSLLKSGILLLTFIAFQAPIKAIVPLGTGVRQNPSFSPRIDTIRPAKKDSTPPALYPKFILYIAPGIGGNVGKQIGQVQKSDMTDLTSSLYVLHGVRNERPSFDYDVGIQITALSTKKLFLRVGVGIENIVYNGVARGVVYKYQNKTFTDSVQEDWSYTYQDEFLQIPLSLSYRISEEGKNYMGINLGVTGSLLIQETCSGVRPDVFNFRGQSTAFGSGSFIYVFQSHRPGEGSLSIEPELKYMLNPISDRRVFWTCGIKLGLAFGYSKAP